MDLPSSQLANRVTLITKVETSGRSATCVPRACKDLYVSTAVHGVLANTLAPRSRHLAREVDISSTSEIWRKLLVRGPKTYGDSRLRTHDNLYRDLAKVGQTRNSSNAKSDVAERHGLRVLRGRIPVPDLRLEHQTPEHELVRIDLELATEHYRFKNIAQKIRAGFAIYARTQDAPPTRRVLEQREITAEILNL
jgi:hypothetical protein